MSKILMRFLIYFLIPCFSVNPGVVPAFAATHFSYLQSKNTAGFNTQGISSAAIWSYQQLAVHDQARFNLRKQWRPTSLSAFIFSVAVVQTLYHALTHHNLEPHHVFGLAMALNPPSLTPFSLDKDEKDVLALYARGWDTGQIAQRRGENFSTTDKQLVLLRQKIKQHVGHSKRMDRWEFIWFLYEKGLVPPLPEELEAKKKALVDSMIELEKTFYEPQINANFQIMRQGTFAIRAIAAQRPRDVQAVAREVNAFELALLGHPRFQPLRTLAQAANFNLTPQMMAILTPLPKIIPSSSAIGLPFTGIREDSAYYAKNAQFNDGTLIDPDAIFADLRTVPDAGPETISYQHHTFSFEIFDVLLPGDRQMRFYVDRALIHHERALLKLITQDITSQNLLLLPAHILIVAVDQSPAWVEAPPKKGTDFAFITVNRSLVSGKRGIFWAQRENLEIFQNIMYRTFIIHMLRLESKKEMDPSQEALLGYETITMLEDLTLEKEKQCEDLFKFAVNLINFNSPLYIQWASRWASLPFQMEKLGLPVHDLWKDVELHLQEYQQTKTKVSYEKIRLGTPFQDTLRSVLLRAIFPLTSLGWRHSALERYWEKRLLSFPINDPRQKKSLPKRIYDTSRLHLNTLRREA